MGRCYPFHSEDSIEGTVLDVPDASRPAGGAQARSGRRGNVTLLLAGICVLAGGLSCPSEKAREASRPAREAADLTVFVTGYELGSLRPCGCSGGQLGGLERRSAIFNRVPASNRLVVETGALVESDREQDLLKFHVFFEGLGLLQYDVVHLMDQDVAIATRLGLPAGPQQTFEVIAAAGEGRSRVFRKRFVARGRELIVSVAAWDPAVSPVEDVGGLFEEIPGVMGLDVLILPHCDPDSVATLVSRVAAVDCIVCPSDAEEPRLLSEPGARPLVFTVGRFGRYVCRLDVAASEPAAEPTLQFEPIPVVEKLASDPVLVGLYRQYQQLVKEGNLLEQYPRVALPADLAFVGSQTCKRCHEYEYDKWSTKAHAGAFATLEEVSSAYDPECVVCHVVGMEYESGFVTGEKTPHLKDVGCENCHGPGSKHVLASGQTATIPPKMACLDCHTPEKSTGYAGHEQEYRQKIVHWREPIAIGNVKHQ